MYCISISHKRAPAYIREQYAFTKAEQSEFIRKLKEEQLVTGAVILCTCNRSELYFSRNEENKEEGMDLVKEAFAAFKQVPKEELLRYLNVYEEDSAITHLFKVCGGFESKILGEDEILRQVKEAYEQAKSLETTEYELNMVFQKAIACAKKIKTDTELSHMPVSIATLTANEVFHFEKEGKKTVLLMGISGKIGGDVAKNLCSKRDVTILGTARNFQSLHHKESAQIKLIPYAERYSYVNEADVIISATSSPHYTLCATETQEALTEAKPRMFLDLAMPRDVDPEIAKITGASLLNIDYFDTVSKQNGTLKLEELDRATLIMEEEREELLKELLFHGYREQIPEWKAVFEEVPLERILYRMKKKSDTKSLQTVLQVFGELGNWVKDE